jgi:hypothetical protein
MSITCTGISPDELLIGDHTPEHVTHDVTVDDEVKARGLIPRDYGRYPVGCYASAPGFHAVDMPLIPQGEWSERIRDKVATKSQLSDIRLSSGPNGGLIPSLDQDSVGYCWAHSTTGCVMMLRAVMGEPYVALSAFAVASIIKHYKDEGGWGAQSLDFVTERGVPSDKFWPMKSRDRSNDKPETWANAALHKVTQGWVDLQAAQYDRNLTFAQVATLLLCNVPCVGDFNWWGHSVCLLDLVDGSQQRHMTRSSSGKLLSFQEFDRVWGMDDEVTSGFSIRLLNSWSDSWSDRGMGVISGNKAIPNGSVAPRVTLPSPV